MYRGFNLKKEDIDRIYKVEKNINLLGFTSTTANRATAINFAVDPSNLEGDDPEKTPVLLIIEFTGKQQYFFLDSKNVSAYPEE